MATKPSAKKKTTPRKQVAEPDEDRRVFTVRDLNRHPQMVLRAAAAYGRVRVNSRSGERFVLLHESLSAGEVTDDSSAEKHLSRLRDLHQSMAAKGLGFSDEGWESFSTMIAGE